ncbi:hypothetical protein [Acinetobacter towneri]|nr:hypothetical protein [Acinetobacter towneri]
MCLNDVISSSKSLNNYEQILDNFLSSYYPEKSSFEI